MGILFWWITSKGCETKRRWKLLFMKDSTKQLREKIYGAIVYEYASESGMIHVLEEDLVSFILALFESQKQEMEKKQGKDLITNYLDLPLDIDTYLTNEEGSRGVGVEGFNKGIKVHINSVRIFRDGKILYFIDGTIHGWNWGSFRLF